MEDLKPNSIDSQQLDVDHLRVFRVDRFNDYQVLKRQFYLPYANQFEEGEFRKRIPFMYMGKLLRVKFEFYGPRIEPVLDRFAYRQPPLSNETSISLLLKQRFMEMKELTCGY